MNLNIAFICVGNSCRSQMAEGFAKYYSGYYSNDLDNKNIGIYSAGTEPADFIWPNAIKVMNESGVDITSQYPKTLDKIPGNIDIVITMGCNVNCPYLPSLYREDWGIDDPVGQDMEIFRQARDKIQSRVKHLFECIKSSTTVDELIEKIKSS